MQGFECVALDFAKVFTEQFCSFLVTAEEEDLGNFVLVLELTIIVVVEGGGSDDLDEFVVLYFVEFAAQGLEGGEGLDLEVGQELVEVFLVLRVVHLGVDPVVGHLSLVFQAHLLQFLHEERVLVFGVHV